MKVLQRRCSIRLFVETHLDGDSGPAVILSEVARRNEGTDATCATKSQLLKIGRKDEVKDRTSERVTEQDGGERCLARTSTGHLLGKRAQLIFLSSARTHDDFESEGISEGERAQVCRVRPAFPPSPSMASAVYQAVMNITSLACLAIYRTLTQRYARVSERPLHVCPSLRASLLVRWQGGHDIVGSVILPISS